MLRKSVVPFLLVFLSLLFCGCGYTTKAVMPSGIKTVAVPDFKENIPIDENYTYEAGLGIGLTNAVIDRLIYDGNLKVADEDKADAVLYGDVTGYRQEIVRYDDYEGAEQYRLIISLKLRFVKNDGTVIWEENNFSTDTEYFISGNDAKTEREALNELLEDTAKNIVDRIVEDW